MIVLFLVFSMIGMCFSVDASSVFSLMRVMSCPQQTRVPPAAWETSMIFPQRLHL